MSTPPGISGFASHPTDPAVRHTRLRFTAQRLMVAVAILAISTVATGIYFAPGNRFMRRYERLRLPMTVREVDCLFGKEAEYECRLRDARIRYSLRPTPLSFVQRLGPADFPPGARVASAAGLPIIYAAAQVAFDRRGRA